MSGDGDGNGGVVVTDEWAPLKRPLLFLGAVSLFASIVSYRKKQTNLFKMSYASTCVTLGPATVLFALPERDEKLEAMLLKNQKRRNDTEEMLAEMRRVAASSPAKVEKSRYGKNWNLITSLFFFLHTQAHAPRKKKKKICLFQRR